MVDPVALDFWRQTRDLIIRFWNGGWDNAGGEGHNANVEEEGTVHTATTCDLHMLPAKIIFSCNLSRTMCVLA